MGPRGHIGVDQNPHRVFPGGNLLVRRHAYRLIVLLLAACLGTFFLCVRRLLGRSRFPRGTRLPLVRTPPGCRPLSTPPTPASPPSPTLLVASPLLLSLRTGRTVFAGCFFFLRLPHRFPLGL